MKRNEICHRWKKKERSGRPSVGLAGQPGWFDGPTWKTSNPVCQQCGEMLGTARARHGRNRFFPTINAMTCADCGTSICETCSHGWRTDQIVGTMQRRTEGGARLTVPRYEVVRVCDTCHTRREAAHEPQDDPGIAALKKLGLW